MKKIYQNPEMKVIKIQTAKMLAASQLGIGDNVNTAEGADARRFDSFWDDEEDFEEDM